MILNPLNLGIYLLCREEGGADRESHNDWSSCSYRPGYHNNRHHRLLLLLSQTAKTSGSEKSVSLVANLQTDSLIFWSITSAKFCCYHKRYHILQGRESYRAGYE